MSTPLNDNIDNKYNYNYRYNDKNDNDNKNKIKQTANFIADKLKDRENIKFYYWATWRLPERMLKQFCILAAEKGNNPAALFNWLVNKQIKINKVKKSKEKLLTK